MRATTQKTSIIIGAALAVLAVLFILGSALQRQDQDDGAASPDCCASDGAPDDGAPVGDPPGDGATGGDPSEGEAPGDGATGGGNTGGEVPDGEAQNPFADADQRMDQMVDTQATWHAPSQTPVDETTQIGLSIGAGDRLRREIEEVLPDVPSQTATPLRVGTDVSARLIGDSSDVSITPDDAINASTGSDIALLWTWDIHPRHPADRLELTALVKMTAPGTDHQLTKILHVHLRVTRTLGFTAHQVFTNWGTWTAVVMALVGSAGWMWRTTRRRKQSPAASEAPPLGQPSDPADAAPAPPRPPPRR